MPRSSLSEDERDRTGVSIGTGVGGAGTQDVLYRRYYAEKIPRAHPFSIPRTMNSAAASQVGMAYGLRGPGICVSTACASAGPLDRRSVRDDSRRPRRCDARRRRRRADHGAGDQGVGSDARAGESVRPGDGVPAVQPRSAGNRDRRGRRACSCSKTGNARGRAARGCHAELVGYGATADAGHITQPGIDAPAQRDQARADAKRACNRNRSTT